MDQANPLTAEQIAEILNQARPHLEALVRAQAGYDSVGWEVKDTLANKYRHMGYHLRDAVNALDRIAEANEHAEVAGRIPTDDDMRKAMNENGILIAELMFSVLQLAELGDVDITTMLGGLWARNAAKFAPTSEYAALARPDSIPAL